MKICWDNIEGIYLTKNGFFRKNTSSYIIDVCVECNEEYLKEKREKRRAELYCSLKCSNKGKNNPMYGLKGEYSPQWKGGEYRYWHKKARELFGKDICELCDVDGILHMHNTLNPKDYTVMEQRAWQCLCNSCHQKVEESHLRLKNH